MEIDVPEGTENDCGIGNVEGWPAVPREMKVEKIDDVAAEEPVEGIPDNAAGNEAKADLIDGLLKPEFIAENSDEGEDDEGKDDQEPGKSFHYSPCGPVINRIDEIEKTGKDFQTSKRRIEAEGETGKLHNDPLGDLVAGKNREENQPEAWWSRQPAGERRPEASLSCHRHRPRN